MKKLYKKFVFVINSLFYTYEHQARKAGVIIGKNTVVASRFWSTEPYLIKIGSNCQITQGVKIFTHGGGGAVRNKIPDFDCFGRVCIGDYVYIGNNSLIMPGVFIGDNVLVAAGSVVCKSVPSGVVVGGNPAKIISTIDDYIRRNIKYNLNSKSMSQQDKKNLLTSLSDEMFVKKKYML